jgi:hypothetical protein
VNLIAEQADPGLEQGGVEQEIAAAARGAGLTPAAYKVVGPPWVETMPIADMKALTPVDINSIRSMLRGEPNTYWPQALTTLAIVGTSTDVKIAQHALELPVAAVAAGTDIDQETKDAYRLLVRIKLTAPDALGILANRTNSSAAVQVLKDTANIEKAASLVGPAAAKSLSRNALSGLAISNSRAADVYLTRLFKSATASTGKHNLAPTNAAGGVATVPLSDAEIKALQKSSASVRKIGIEAYLRGGTG